MSAEFKSRQSLHFYHFAVNRQEVIYIFYDKMVKLYLPLISGAVIINSYSQSYILIRPEKTYYKPCNQLEPVALQDQGQ